MYGDLEAPSESQTSDAVRWLSVWLCSGAARVQISARRPLTSPSLWFHTCEGLSTERPYLGGLPRGLGDMGHTERGAHSQGLLSKCNCCLSGLRWVEGQISRHPLRALGWDGDPPSCRAGTEQAALRLAWLVLTCPPDSGACFHGPFSVKEERSWFLWARLLE